MNKVVWIAGALVLLAAIGGVYTYIRTQSNTAPTYQTTGDGNAVVGANGASTIITYTNAGFSPTPQTIAPGTTVTWSNESSQAMWIQGADSNGSECTGTDERTKLNECASVQKGGSYSYTFTRLGTFPYTNHEQSGDAGSVIVTEASSSGPLRADAIPE